MATNKVIIALKYDDPDGKLGNRWKDGKTYLFLFPAPADKLRAGESGKWDSDRQSDIDSSGGSDHAIYKWDIVNKQVNIMSGGWQEDSMTEIIVKLNGFNYIDRGSGSGTFRFRKSDVPITWKIEAVEAT